MVRSAGRSVYAWVGSKEGRRARGARVVERERTGEDWREATAEVVRARRGGREAEEGGRCGCEARGELGIESG